MKYWVGQGSKNSVAAGKRRIRAVSAVAGLAVLLSICGQAHAAPFNLNGKLGYYYTFNKTDGGAESDSQNIVGSLNARSYIWQPWFATLNVGGSASSTKSDSQSGSTETKFISGQADLGLFPRSRYPFTASYSARDDVIDLYDPDAEYLVDFGGNYRTRNLRLQQSFITIGGNRVDIFHRNNLKGNDIYGDITDKTLGGSVKWRLPNHNFYLNTTRTTQERSLLQDKAENRLYTMTYTFNPSSEFYIKALGNGIENDNTQPLSNSSFFKESTTSLRQGSGMFYWRPEYKRYAVTGAMRLHSRSQESDTDPDVDGADQDSFTANLALSYHINRRLRAMVSATGTVLDSSRRLPLGTVEQNTGSFNALSSLNYQSDRILFSENARLFNGFSYYWNWDVSLGSNALAEYESIDFEQENLGVGIGHNTSKSWITGNRSTLRLNLTQGLRSRVLSEDTNEGWDKSLSGAFDALGNTFDRFEKGDRDTSANHAVTLAWTESLRKAQIYTQATAFDTRSLNEDIDSQVINLQASGNMPINRLSSFGIHGSVQSTRRHTPETGDDNFLTTATGRVNYKHQRLFGIYKLRFRARVDHSRSSNRAGGDRSQTELEARAAYQVGLLSTSLTGRWISTDTGLGSNLWVFTVDRSF